jgi:superfamily II DNA or RNA helicase
MPVFLQDKISDIRFEDLPANWNSFDLESFSKNKKLWDYQQEALKNAIKVLWKYFEDFSNFEKNENVIGKNKERKAKLYKWYKDNGLEEDLSIRLEKRKTDVYNLLTEYYPQENGEISFEHLINRMCFWMATGSGKTLVIVKLIQILKGLMEREEIPSFNILILTYRDDLIQQLKRHVTEFNYGGNGVHINLRELKEFPEIKRQQLLLKENEITVFYYRSDNLSDEQKEKIVNFKNYDDSGKWYVFLDEAHKGDKEESKRQHIYSILSRNGFLFNFSATFVDDRDKVTTAFNFNLERFINSGYGKHISILKQEIRAFRNEEDYSGDEKQKIVLKSLILLTYVKKSYERIKNIYPEMYHNPLLLTLVNSVNTEDADLKLFFRELERIGAGDVDDELFNAALNELWQELKNEPEYIFEEGNALKIDEAVFKEITKQDILKYVYNSQRSGQIEILIRPSNRKEMAFKLKTSDRPFALIKIGDISGWLKEEFAGYEVQERFEDESYFESLNREDSDINILMGSRTFYEGWDSNRPNVINYINIGTGEDARKFILQSVGRGIRIEPIKNKRKRLLHLYNAKEVGDELFHKIHDKAPPIETLFIFGTNRNALDKVIKELELQKRKEGEFQISLYVNDKAQKQILLVPAYKDAENPLLKETKQIKFELSEKDMQILKSFIEYVNDDRIILMRYNTEPIKIQLLRENIKEQNNFKLGQKSFKNIDLLVQRIFDYFSIIPKQLESLHELRNEIIHFTKIKVYLKEISELSSKIETVKNYPKNESEVKAKYGEIPSEEYIELVKKLKKEEDFEANHKKIRIKYVANHYYIPLILSEDEKIDYIRHIIKHKSEVKFIDDLENYLSKNNNKFKEYDWWLFSKLDETLDEIYIPYYNPNGNKISNFFPDFIFWLKKGNEYQIIFVDPKGVQHIDWAYKIEGYKWLFEDGTSQKTFDYKGLKVKIKLLFRTDDVAKIPPEYRQYWFDNIEKILS